MATGLVTAGNGAAALITAPLANTLIAHYGVLPAIRTLGLGLLVISLVCGASGAMSGLMIAANASPIGQNMFALSSGVAALYVGFYAASSAAGRFLWGAVSDRIGGANSLVIIFVLVALMLLLLATTSSPVGFVIAICGIGIALVICLVGAALAVMLSLALNRWKKSHA